MSSLDKTEAEDLGKGSPRYLAEITEIVKKLLTSKATGAAEIYFDMSDPLKKWV